MRLISTRSPTLYRKRTTMKTRIVRIKKYLSDHRAPIAWSAGVVAGAVPTAYILSKKFVEPEIIDIFFDETPEQIKKLLEANGGIGFTEPFSTRNVNLISKVAVEKLASDSS